MTAILSILQYKSIYIKVLQTKARCMYMEVFMEVLMMFREVFLACGLMVFLAVVCL